MCCVTAKWGRNSSKKIFSVVVNVRASFLWYVKWPGRHKLIDSNYVEWLITVLSLLVNKYTNQIRSPERN